MTQVFFMHVSFYHLFEVLLGFFVCFWYVYFLSSESGSFGTLCCVIVRVGVCHTHTHSETRIVILSIINYLPVYTTRDPCFICAHV